MNHVLAQSLPIVGRAVADKVGVRFYIQGNQAYTTYDSIVIPYGDFNDPDFVAKGLGFTIHEGGHIRFTDKDAKKDLVNNIAYAFYKAIEDVRMENEVISEFPGAHSMLHDLVKMVIKGGQFPTIVDGVEMPDEQKLSFYALYRLRHEVLNQTALKETAETSEETIKRHFPKGMLTRLNALMFQVTSAQSTRDVVTTCNDIAQMLEEEAKKQSEQSQSNPSSQEEEPSPSDDDTQSDEPDQSQDDTDDTADGDASNQEAMPDSGDPSDNPDGDDTSDDSSDPTTGSTDTPSPSPSSSDDAAGKDQEPSDPSSQNDGDDGHGNGDINLQELIDDGDWDNAGTDLGDIIKDMIDEDESVKEASGTSRCYPSMGDEVAPPSNQGNAHDLIIKSQGACNALAVRLQNLVEASSLAEVREGLEGDLDTNLLWKAAIGDNELFLDEDEIIEVNTGIQILLDRSGSMRKRIGIAREAALATGLALERIDGTQIGVAAFPAFGGHVQPLTRLGESVRQTALRYNIGTTGCTPMAEAMLWSINELAWMNVDRRMLMVVTDGDPDDSQGVKDLLALCKRCDIQTMGIGIASRSVERLFPSYCVIKTVDELASAMFGMLQPLMINKKAA